MKGMCNQISHDIFLKNTFILSVVNLGDIQIFESMGNLIEIKTVTLDGLFTME